MAKTRIIPCIFPDEQSNNVTLSGMTATYRQNVDSMQDKDDLDWQELTIEAVPSEACLSEEEAIEKPDEAFFYRLRTNCWSIEEPDNIADIVKDFKMRLHGKLNQE